MLSPKYIARSFCVWNIQKNNRSPTSNYREVPDNQEIYVSSTYDTDISIILELTQRVEAADDDAAIAIHWSDVVADGHEGKLFFCEQVNFVDNLYDHNKYLLIPF
jgi:hypothetical protein